MQRKTFLERLSDEELDALKSKMVIRHHKNRAEIISHEQDARDVYFVLEGMARARIISKAGKIVNLRNIREGEIFGELAAIDDLPRSASIIALGQVTCGSMSARQFRDLVATTPSFTWALLGHLSQQCRAMTERIYEYSTMYVRPRVIRELLRLGQPINGQDHLIISPVPSQEDMARWISTHREQVNRELGDLEELGLIDRSDKKKIVLLDLEALRAESDLSD